MTFRIITTICLALAAMAANAQTTHFLDSLRKVESGKGKVIVMQSPEIDKAVNGTDMPIAKTNVAEEETNAATAPAASSNSAKENHLGAHPSGVITGVNSTLSANDTRKKIITNGRKVTGYRIQVYSGGNKREDRQMAQEAGNRVKSNFPTEPVYVHFYSPSWKCRMGNYRDLKEAQEVLARVKAMGFKQACIVKGTISVSY